VFFNKPQVRRFSAWLREYRTDLLWGGFLRADLLDEETASALFASGCRLLFCGIESGDEGMLQRMSKHLDLEKARAGIDCASAAGIAAQLAFLVGFPGETHATLDRTASFLDQLSMGGAAHPSYSMNPLYIQPLTAVDSAESRRRWRLRGRGDHWTHETMDSSEATALCDRLFTRVERVPIVHAAAAISHRGETSAVEHPAGLSIALRNEAFIQRQRLTVALLEQGSDHVVQEHFERLHGCLTAQGARAPDWREVLADRSLQPGGDEGRRRLALGHRQIASVPGAPRRSPPK
jgi:hypothetical protein